MSPTPEHPPDRPTADIILSQLAPDLASTPAPAPAWEGEPVPLSARRLLPPFPIDALPGWVADMVAAVAEATQTPSDLAGCLALACVATAAGGRVVVEVRPGWREPTNLFTVVALPPGARKSTVFTTMTASLLAEQDGRLAVLSSEGGIFTTLAGRYSGAPNLEVFLKGHAGDLLIVDRKGREHEYVEHPALTLGLAVQPEVLTDIAAMPGFRGRGLLARILYSLPASTVGRRKIGPQPAPEPVVTAYGTNLGALVLTLADWTDPAVLPLTPEANEAVLHLEETIEPRLLPGHGDLAPIVDWASKYVGAVVRIAGLLHLAAHRDAARRPISADTIHAAARIGHYYLGHALAVFDLMGADPLIDHARHVLDWITRTGTQHCTRRELFRAMPRGRFVKVGDLDPVLDLLDQHG